MDKRPAANHVHETHSEGSLWKKPWRKAKKETKGHRVQRSRISFDQQGLCNEDESWLEYRAYLFNQMPSLSSAAKAAFSIGTALVSVPAAEILDPPKLATASSTNLPSQPLKKSETRLKTLEEEAVSAALAAAAATAAAAAERARIAAQAALAMQAEQEMEAAKANEEAQAQARLARESAQLEDKSPRQGGLACSLLSKRRRPTKTRTQRGSVQQQQSYSSDVFSKRDPNAPIHSRPPPPMVSPRFAARLVELISSAAPVPVPQYPLSKPTQLKRTSVNRPSPKGQTGSPLGTGSVSGSQSSSTRSQTSSAARSYRPPQQQPTPSVGRQPSSPPPPPAPATAHHPSVPSTQPTLPAQPSVPPGGQSIPPRAHPTVPSTCTVTAAHASPPTTNAHQPPPSYQPPQAQSPQVLQTALVHQPPAAHQPAPQRPSSTNPTPQVQPSPKTPVQPPYSPPPLNKPGLPPPYMPPPKPLVQCPFSSPPPKPLVQFPYSPPLPKPLVHPPYSPPPVHSTLPPFHPPPPYSYGASANIHQESSTYQPLHQPPTQPSFASNQSYQPASHMYGTLPRKTQLSTQTLNPTSPEFTPQPTTMAHVTIAMLPNTASTPNQWSQQQPSDPAPPETRTSNQRQSAATRPSVVALLRSGIRSLGKTSVSVAALDRPKTDTSVAWNTAKIAAPADESVPSCPEQRILPPSDLSENDSTVWFHHTTSQPSIPWSTAWQNPPPLPMYNEDRLQQKQEANSWQQESYNFSLDMSTGATVPQTIYEVDHAGSLSSLPQAYVPMDTVAPQGAAWWPKGSPDQKNCTWDKNMSLAPPLGQQPQRPSSPPQRTNCEPSNWLPPSQSPAWHNQPPGDEKDKKRMDEETNHVLDNSAKMSFQESMYQQTIFHCDYQQLPSQQQHYPETVVEEASSEEPQ